MESSQSTLPPVDLRRYPAGRQFPARPRGDAPHGHGSSAVNAEAASFLPSGHFQVGCNYWASHAGSHMWSDWQPEVIAADFAQLAESRLKLVRVFPLWPDFQPLHRLCSGEGEFIEYRFGEAPLPDDPVGQAGVDAAMLGRFRTLADEAQRHGLQLIVGLITGWMSGRLFSPPAFTNLNVIANPEVVRWQARFVRCFVEALCDHPAIVAWDLGNECNVMGAATAAEAWLWTHTMTSAIRVADPTRPVVSGMHTTPADPNKAWSIRDQSDLTDFLTTHPYPIWTPHCDQDPANTIRTQLHSTAESLLYAGIGGKPCFAEEMGSMGPFIISDELAPQFLRPALFSLWAHDCRAMLWWCAYDQTLLTRAPYDWTAIEQELGLHRNDRTAKPIVGAISDFSRLVEALPPLPPRLVDGVCLLSPDQDQWGVAYHTFILSKLAGVDLTFQWCEDALQPSDVYLLPSIAGAQPIHRRRWVDLLARVEAGATLYLSLDTGLLAGLETVFGVEVTTRSRRAGDGRITLAGDSRQLAADFRLTLRATRAEVLAAEEDGNPIFTRCAFGSGQVFFLTAPLERGLASTPAAFQRGGYKDAWKFYASVFAGNRSGRAWRKTTPEVAVTEHPEDDGSRLIVLINHSPAATVEPVSLAAGWRLGEVLHGQANAAGGVVLAAADGAVLRLRPV